MGDGRKLHSLRCCNLLWCSGHLLLLRSKIESSELETWTVQLATAPSHPGYHLCHFSGFNPSSVCDFWRGRLLVVVGHILSRCITFHRFVFSRDGFYSGRQFTCGHF